MLCWVFDMSSIVLCLAYPMLPVSLDSPFLISPSVFSNIYHQPYVNNILVASFINGGNRNIWRNRRSAASHWQSYRVWLCSNGFESTLQVRVFWCYGFITYVHVICPVLALFEQSNSVEPINLVIYGHWPKCSFSCTWLMLGNSKKR